MNLRVMPFGLALFVTPFDVDQWRQMYVMLAPAPPLAPYRIWIPPAVATPHPKVDLVTIDYPKPTNKAFPRLPDANITLIARNVLSRDLRLTLCRSGLHRWLTELHDGLRYEVVEHVDHVELRVRPERGPTVSSDQLKQFQFLNADANPARLYYSTRNSELFSAGHVYFTIEAK